MLFSDNDSTPNRGLSATSQATRELGDSQKFLEIRLINKLLRSPDLRGWERLFVTTIAKSAKPGLRQIEKVLAIANRLGIQGGER